MSKGCYHGSPDKQWEGGLDKTLSWTRAVAMVLGGKNGQIPDIIWKENQYNLLVVMFGRLREREG